MNEHFSPLDPKHVAAVLGGNAYGNQVRAPGPGHSRDDRSMSVQIDSRAPDGFVAHSFAGDPWEQCRDYVNGKLGRPPWEKVNGETSKEILDSIIAQAKREPFNFNAARQQRATQSDTAQPHRVCEYIYQQPDGTPYHRVD